VDWGWMVLGDEPDGVNREGCWGGQGVGGTGKNALHKA